MDAGTTCFANPGTSEMQLAYEIGMTDKVRPTRRPSPAPERPRSVTGSSATPAQPDRDIRP